MGRNFALHEPSAVERLRLVEPFPGRCGFPSSKESFSAIGLEALAEGKVELPLLHHREIRITNVRSAQLPEASSAATVVAADEADEEVKAEGRPLQRASSWQLRRHAAEKLVGGGQLFVTAASSNSSALSLPQPRSQTILPELPSPHVTISVPLVSVQDSSFVSSCKVFCCGAVAGSMSRTATAPLDRLRTVLVLQGASRNGSQRRTGMLAELQHIYTAGGWRAFYQGNGTNVLKIAPESAVRFMVFEYLQERLALRRRSDSSTAHSTLERFVAGSVAGMTSQLVIYPLEVIKTRLAAASPGYFKGIRDCGLKAIQQGGVLALYRGLGTSLLGMIPYAGVDLCVYTTLRDRLPSAPSPNPLLLGACGIGSSVVAQICSFPLGLVRSRLQAQGMSHDRPVLYHGMVDCLRKTYQYCGLRGLYAGMLPTLLKVVPATSLSYVVYERCKVLLDVKPHK